MSTYIADPAPEKMPDRQPAERRRRARPPDQPDRWIEHARPAGCRPRGRPPKPRSSQSGQVAECANDPGDRQVMRQERKRRVIADSARLARVRVIDAGPLAVDDECRRIGDQSREANTQPSATSANTGTAPAGRHRRCNTVWRLLPRSFRAADSMPAVFIFVSDVAPRGNALVTRGCRLGAGRGNAGRGTACGSRPARAWPTSVEILVEMLGFRPGTHAHGEPSGRQLIMERAVVDHPAHGTSTARCRCGRPVRRHSRTRFRKGRRPLRGRRPAFPPRTLRAPRNRTFRGRATAPRPRGRCERDAASAAPAQEPIEPYVRQVCRQRPQGRLVRTGSRDAQINLGKITHERNQALKAFHLDQPSRGGEVRSIECLGRLALDLLADQPSGRK